MRPLLAVVLLMASGPLAPPEPAAQTVALWRSSQGRGERLAAQPDLRLEPLPQPDEHDPTVMVDPAKAFQTVQGIGGALTDASAETFAKLPREAQDRVLEAYFDAEKGIGYSLARTHINSCDFSSDSYAYADRPGDVELRSF